MTQQSDIPLHRGFSLYELLLARLVLEKGFLGFESLLAMTASIGAPARGALETALRSHLTIDHGQWRDIEAEADRRLSALSDRNGSDTGETVFAVNPTGDEAETLFMPDHAIMRTEFISELTTIKPTDAKGRTVVVDENLSDTPGPAATVMARATDGAPGSFMRIFKGPRYTVGREIARGGHGRINLARDERLGRHIALKQLIAGGTSTSNQRRKFILEARATGLLEHPNIVPVYDLGVLDTGEVYFTMKMVRGRSLKYIIYKQSQGDAKMLSQYGRIRMLMIFQQVCNAVHFAHHKGIVHRDIKPENIMVGNYGEVLMMDWGLAKIIDVHHDDDEEPSSSIMPDDLEKTRVGTISGTPSYMAPEQARGRIDLIDQRTDVYALGAILYEMLTYHPPFEGKNIEEVLEKVRHKEPVPPRRLVPENNIPVDLEDIILKAMSKDPEKRYSTAKDLNDEVEQFLEGSKQRERNQRRAIELVRRAKSEFNRYFEVRKQTVATQGQTEELLREGIEGLSGERLWKSEMESLVGDVQLDRMLGNLKASLTEAISLYPTLDQARIMLADVYYTRFTEAEQGRNKKEMIYNRGHIEALAPQRYKDVLAGGGTVSFRGHNGRGRWRVFANSEQNGRLVPVPIPETSGNVEAVMDLPVGNYIIEVNVDNRRLVFPLLLEKGENVTLAMDIPPLPRPPVDGLEMITVPGSRFLKGGDLEAVGYLKISEPYVQSYAISRYPVTVAQYHHFLHETCDSEKQFLRRAPRIRSKAGVLWRPQDSLARIEGRLGWKPDFPVVNISWYDAMEYCSWLSSLSGRVYRLPTDEEWEKAARGVDGRTYPWGNGFEPTWCCMRDTSADSVALWSVGSCRTDTSPFGVRDMAGGVREWCHDWAHEPTGERLVRGGSWLDPEAFCRAASRTGYPADRVKPNIGFRVVLDLDGG